MPPSRDQQATLPQAPFLEGDECAMFIYLGVSFITPSPLSSVQ